MGFPANHLKLLTGDTEAGSKVFTAAEEKRGRYVKIVSAVGVVKLGAERSHDAVEGRVETEWEEGYVPLNAERLDMVIEALQVARFQAFGTPLT